MLQEDSNGDTSFEIVDKKNGESSNNETLSGVSSPYSIPSPSVAPIPVTAGILLSNLPTPSNLPGDFTLWQTQAIPAPTPLPANLLPPSTKVDSTSAPGPVNVQPLSQPFPPTQFSAAIPPSKGVHHGPVPQSSTDTNPAVGGLIGWMKDAVSSGGILSKVAEKAKNSVDSLITTLDPQMSEFIYSGGDLEFAVASQDPDEIVPIREATFSVFGKAWVNGVDLNFDDKKHQAVGYEEGVKNAEEKINLSLQSQKIPTIAVENILLSQNNMYFDLSVLILNDTEKHIKLKTFTQTTPIPIDNFLKDADKEMAVYSKECDSKEKLLSAFLKIKRNNWQQSVGGVSRKETLYLAARTLMTLYKNKITGN